MRGVWLLKQVWLRWRERLLVARANYAVRRFPRSRPQPHGLPYPLIVSLTSYPPRFPTLAKTLKSLLDQSIAADRTILWIAGEDMAALPDDVRALEHHGLEIRECEDICSYKKLIPALAMFPDAAICTVDDDCFYRTDLLENLIEAFEPKDASIVCGRAHFATLGADGRFAPYVDWAIDVSERCDLDDFHRVFPTGVGGVLYPPNALPAAVTDAATFMEICPTADDVWFFWMAEMAGTPQRRIAASLPLIPWDGSQEAGLLHHNVAGNFNDVQMLAMANHFGPLTTFPSAR